MVDAARAGRTAPGMRLRLSQGNISAITYKCTRRYALRFAQEAPHAVFRRDPQIPDATRDPMSFHPLRRTILLAALLLLGTVPASAHHLMGGKAPSTFLEGLLSGLGHPLIGPDHLAFLLAVGVATGVGGLNPALPALFVAASGIGVVLHVNAVNLPGAELAVAASLLLAGVLI